MQKFILITLLLFTGISYAEFNIAKIKEGTVEWLIESKKEEKIEFTDFWEDLFNNKPGDSWNDYERYFEFTLASIGSFSTFLAIASGGDLPGEARWKSFTLISVIVILKEIVVSATNKDAHFCAKNLSSGICGALGGLLISIPIR